MDFSSDLSLYLPDHCDGQTLEQYIDGQRAIQQFLSLKLTPSQLGEILHDGCGVNLDHWLECVSFNVNQ